MADSNFKVSRRSLLGIVLLLLLPSGLAWSANADPSTANPSVDPLPAGWKAGQFDTDDLKTGSNSDLQAHFELQSNPKAVFGNMTFADWAKYAKSIEAKHSAITNRHETDLKPVKLGNYEGMEYEVTGELFGQSFHYRYFLIPVRGVYATLNCWCDAKTWDAAKSKFEDLVVNLK